MCCVYSSYELNLTCPLTRSRLIDEDDGSVSEHLRGERQPLLLAPGDAADLAPLPADGGLGALA